VNLSHGLPWLATAGNQIVRADSREPVRLRGVNRSGLEYSEPGESGFLQAAGISQAEIREIVEAWHSSVIRLPFNQDWALHGRGKWSAEDYQRALDQVIEWAAQCGAYTILDLQWLDADTPCGTIEGKVNRVPPLPDSGTIDLWSALAERYKDEPAVLLDLFNEPHRPLTDHAGAPKPCGRKEWVEWARKLEKAIRAIHPRSLLLVSGFDWASDLRGIEIDAENIVYSAHVYPDRAARQWERRFGFVARRKPLFIAEWGGEAGNIEWGARLLAYLGPRACGWTAWSWADYPHLTANAPEGDYAPTAFGQFVRAELEAV
jgi:hypothetical protein